MVVKDWTEKGIYETMDELYNEIWVYGIQSFYDPIQEYSIPDSISCKITFTGYIPRRVPGRRAVRRIKKKHGLKNGDKLVVVTTGGGGDGYALIEHVSVHA